MVAAYYSTDSVARKQRRYTCQPQRMYVPLQACKQLKVDIADMLKVDIREHALLLFLHFVFCASLLTMIKLYIIATSIRLVQQSSFSIAYVERSQLKLLRYKTA